PGETIAFFDPFTQPRSEWFQLGQHELAFDGESASADARTGPLRFGLSVVPQRDVFELAGVMREQTQPVQIAVQIYESESLTYYCELYEMMIGKYAATYSIDGMTFLPIDSTNAQIPIVNDTFMLRLTNAPP